MRSYHKALGLAVLFVLGLIGSYKTLAACANNGPVEGGCGSGESGCAGSCDAQGNGTCISDEAKTLYSGLFVCGTVQGQENCRTSTTEKAVCYITWDCTCSATECVKDNDTKDVFKDWKKTSDNCLPPG